MNYTQRGIQTKQQALNAKSGKFRRKLVLHSTVILLVAMLAIGVLGTSAAFGMYNGILASTPQIRSSQVAPVGAATFILDKRGNKMDELVASNSNRIFITMDKIPEYMGQAIVAIEDERFYEHNGVDYMSMLRAGYQFIKTMGDETQGASTITQQLLKNTIFTDWTSEGDNMIKKIKRKFQEQYLAIELTKILDKDEILERYMNTINTGQNTLGVEAAAQRYFGKSVSDLTISECSVIAVITQSPTKYNPILHPENNAERRATCLKKMLELGFISQSEYDEAVADKVYERIEKHNVDFLENNSTSSYFSDAITYDVRADLLAAGYSETNADFLLNSGGLRIWTTMDPDIQAIVDQVVNDPANYPKNALWQLEYALTVYHPDDTYQNYSQEMMTKYFKKNIDAEFDLLFNSKEEALEAIELYKDAVMKDGDEFDERYNITIQPQISVMIMDQSTGEVVAMAGGRGIKEGRLTLNRATSTYRGPGSTFKVLAAYAPAIDSAGMTLSTVFNDAPFNYDDGTPVGNWYENYRGLNTIRKGIEQSLNIVTVKALTQITPRLGYDYLKNWEFSKITDHYVVNGKVYGDDEQPLALGGVTIGVSNEELTAAYASIANGGIYTKPKLYTKVLDSDGNVILDNTESQTHRVLSETTAFLLTDAMTDVVTQPQGTGKAVNFGNMSIAGKTGTTTDDFDVWFAGYTPYYTCAAWAGYDTPTDMNSEEKNIAKTLWRKIMEQIHADLPYAEFEMPEGIVEMEICSASGKLPNPSGICHAIETITTEYYDEFNVPTETCDVHYTGQICAYENLMASYECPFQYFGNCVLTPIEDESLHLGSTIQIENPDGTITYQLPRTTNICSHDGLFLSQPDVQITINQMWAELAIRQQQAEAAAQAAAQAAQTP